MSGQSPRMEEFFKRLHDLRQRVHENGSAMVKDRGQWTMQLGNERTWDEVLPPTDEEIEWQKDQLKAKPQ